MNYISLFRKSVNEHKNDIAIVDFCGKRSTVYSELDSLSSLVAGKLYKLGCQRGDFVIINMERRMEYIAAYLGILKAGCVAVPTITEYPEERMNYIKTNCEAKAEINVDFFEDIDNYGEICSPADESEPALLLYTSGSTGNPKGILYSAADIFRAAERTKILFDGIDELNYAAMCPLSFVAHITEYLTVFLLGGHSHILSDKIRHSASLMKEYYEREKITAGIITPQMLKLFSTEMLSLKRVITGSERVTQIYSDSYEIYNVYGMSEVSHISVFNIDKKYENTPLGKGIGNINLFVCDDNGQPVKDGEEGEICIHGDFDVQYFKDSERTSRTMIKNPDGTVTVHSGDIGYVNENGDIVYVNRKDWMVKINGQRVETLEIETLLNNIPEIKDAAVKAFEDKNGQTYLVGFYVIKSEIKDTDLRKILKHNLPDYMIPRFFVRMGELPKNINGKLDRKSLQPPETEKFKATYIAPANGLEGRICEAFEEVLGCGTVGVEDDFFALGGDSIKILFLIEKTGLNEFTPDDIASGRTPRGIAAMLNTKKDIQIKENSKSIPAVCPLTQSQMGVYLDSVNEPESIIYNIPVQFSLPNGTDKERFINAVRTVALTHKAFFVTIGEKDGVPSMIYEEKPITVSEASSESFETFTSTFCRPFDLEKGPLYRFVYVETPEGDAFFFDIHHIIFDGTSLSRFCQQIADVYNGGKCSEEELTIFDFSELEKAPHTTEDENKFREYFDSKFDGFDCDSKPVPSRNEKNDCKDWEMIITDVGENISFDKVREFVINNKISENALFLGAFGYALAKFNGTDYSVFTTGNHGRADRRLSNTVGMFVKTLPFICNFDENEAPADYLSRVYNDYYMTKKNDVIPFNEIASRYGLNMSVTFIYQSELFKDVEFENGKGKVDLLIFNNAVADIEFMLMKTESGYAVRCFYLRSDYTESFIQSFIDLFINTVKGMLDFSSLREMNLVSDSDIKKLEELNSTEKEYDASKTVVDLFRIQAEKTPDRVCLVFKENRYTYREVDEITDRLAKYLVRNGFGKEKVLGVLIERSEYMLICALGALKAGGGYLPLDPSYPPERLNFMMSDSGAMILITTPELSSVIDESFTGMRIFTRDIPEIKEENVALTNPGTDDLFVMIYTSGSTGTPKGVMFEHKNALVSVEYFRAFFKMSEETKLASYASYGFDAHVVDIYPPIICGGQVHIIPEEMRLDLIAVRDYFNKNEINHVVMTTQVGRQFALMGGFKTLKHLSVAGEKLTPLEIPEGFNMYNLYGPTEGSVITSAFLIDKYYKDVPIGKAVDNLKLYVVDKYSRLLPVGATGELWISGTHVTRGYLNRPEKTAEAYGENPFESTKGYERVYRTGDIVRLLSDGNLQFIGRRDGQVKIRGFRIELTEVEEVIRRFPGIKDATVAAFDEKSGGKYICAYVVSDEEISKEALSDFIREEKPPYMVPAVIMQIDKIPLNQNHKVNKRALPVPERIASDTTPPENETQKKIFDIVSSVIGHGDFGINTDIYEAGLTSIGAVKLNVELAEAFGVHIKTADIKANETIKKLEKLLTNGEKEDNYGILPDYPITETQSGIFVECMSMPDSTVYNIPVFVRLGDSIDISRLSEAIKKAVNAHPYVKTTLFSDEKGNIRAKRNDDAEIEISVIDCEKAPDADSLLRPYKLLGGSLYRIEIYKTFDEKYLFMDFHHIICDGTSEAIIFRDISCAYAGGELKKEKFTGYEEALEEEKVRSSTAYEKAEEYWKNFLSGCDNECLPKKESESEIPGAGEVGVIYENAERIRRFCETNSFSLNAFFNAAFSFTLSRFINKESPTYATVYNGRSDSRLSESVTMLVRTIPVISNIENETPVKKLISDMQSQLIDSMSFDSLSFAELSKLYGVKADIIFVYQGNDFVFDELCGEKAELISLKFNEAKAPISINVYLKGNRFEISAEYRREIFSKELVSSLLDAFTATITSFTRSEYLKSVSMLSDKGEKLYEKLNNNSFEIENLCCHELFEKAAEKNPDRTAIISCGKEYSYKWLDEKANILANALIEKGVKAETTVGMVIDRDINIFICELGIMKSGGAFLPMIPSYPDDRIEYCLTDSESPFVITTEEIKNSKPELFSKDKPYKTLTVEELLSGNDTNNPNTHISFSQLAYCIYTSGSTGTPKGVMIEHHNFSNFVQANRRLVEYYCDENAKGAALAVGSISFDISLYEIYNALCSGKALCVATEDEIHNPVAMKNLIVENNVQMILCTPSFMNNMMTFPEFAEELKNVRSVMLGAEAFPASLYNKMREISPSLQILNGYGPTETTICCSVKELHSSERITIGRPTGNVKFFVLDSAGNILPPYASGELIICGEDVGRGYVKLPEKTKATFFTLRGMPAYHSGDLVRLNGDAEIDFSGRIDNQVKLRGFRVELDEIENAVCDYEGIRQCKVLVRNNGSEDYLVGFFTSENKTDIDKLTEYLRSRLTYYMVPAILMQLDKMPLTPNGKIDKNGFPEVEKKAKKKEGRRAPKKSLEQRLCEMFASVLGLDEVFADDNFFELGGTSLSASKVTMLLMSDGIEVKYGDIFDNPTPEELSEFIESRDAAKNKSENKPDLPENNTHPALKYNRLRYAPEVKREGLGDVLLTGAVGFLGIHILKELLEIEDGHICCLVRRGNHESAEIRLKAMLIYYFSDAFEKALRDRITIMEADITDPSLYDTLKDIPFDTVINCAACVKHFSDSDILEKINVHGVENLIDVCKKKNTKLIQISTVSVPGIHTEESYEKQIRMHEDELFVIDDMDNKYGISKYHAELKMLDAIESGMRGKIIRVGNLMGRHSDGEFQVNMETNMFMSGIRGFAVMGMYPISHMTDPMRFSPVDCTARAVVLLAGTNDKFTAFNCDNRYGFDEMKIIDSCNRNGIKIVPADDEYYYAEYHKKLGDDRVNAKLNGLAAYDIKDAHAVDTDNLFTTNILYRIGFSWPLVDDTYLDRAINSILTLDYFDIDSPEDN